MHDAKAEKGAQALVHLCANLRAGEKALIIANPETMDVAAIVERIARQVASDIDVVTEPAARMHGGEPNADTAAKMARADVIFCLTSKSLAHSRARFAATEAGARYLSLPDYSLEQLRSPALLFDFTSLADQAERIAARLDRGKAVRVRSAGGTDLSLTIDTRKANRAPGIVRGKGELGSPPDAEVNVAPIEEASTGVIVVDGSIPCNEIGLLPKPVTLHVEGGAIVRMEGHAPAVAALETLFAGAGPKSRVLAEFGIGLNPLAKLCGRMLEDEGCGGTVHFGFGSNATIGGRNHVGFHLDFIVTSPTVEVDGRALDITA